MGDGRVASARFDRRLQSGGRTSQNFVRLIARPFILAGGREARGQLGREAFVVRRPRGRVPGTPRTGTGREGVNREGRQLGRLSFLECYRRVPGTWRAGTA